jgi:hypothetical protein
MEHESKLHPAAQLLIDEERLKNNATVIESKEFTP